MNMSMDYYMETPLLWSSIIKVGRGYIWTISPIVNSIANIKDKHRYINNDLIDVKFSSCNGLTLQQCTYALRALNVWRIYLFLWNYYVVALGIQHLCRPQKHFTGRYYVSKVSLRWHVGMESLQCAEERHVTEDCPISSYPTEGQSKEHTPP